MSRRERMSAADAAWLHMDRPTNLMVINGVVWFDAPLDWTVLTKRIESRWIDRYPRFRQRVAEGRLRLLVPHWEDDPHFALENHLHHIALPAPGDQDALQDFVSDRMSVPIDRTKPLWHVYFIDGYGAGCAVLIRVHHSVADGLAMAQVFQSLTDDAPEPSDSDRGRRGRLSRLAPLTARTGAVVTTAWRLTGAAMTSGRGLVAHPSRLGGVAATGLDDAATMAKLVFTPPDTRTSVTGETAAAKRAVWSPPTPLDDLKAVGQVTGATVNDILLTAVTGALRRYLEAHGGVVDNVRTLVPVNLRPPDRPVPETLGNKFGLVLLDLPVGLPSPLARLAELSQRMAAIKRSPEGAMAFGLLAGIGLTPIPIERTLFDFFATKASAVMTNVPGPRAPWYVAGVRVAGLIGLVPCSGNVPLGVCIVSYAGKVYVSVAVDAVLVPEPQTIVSAFRDELGELVRQAAKAAEAPARARAGRRSGRIRAGGEAPRLVTDPARRAGGTRGPRRALRGE